MPIARGQVRLCLCPEEDGDRQGHGDQRQRPGQRRRKRGGIGPCQKEPDRKNQRGEKEARGAEGRLPGLQAACNKIAGEGKNSQTNEISGFFACFLAENEIFGGRVSVKYELQRFVPKRPRAAARIGSSVTLVAEGVGFEYPSPSIRRQTIQKSGTKRFVCDIGVCQKRGSISTAFLFKFGGTVSSASCVPHHQNPIG